MSRVSSVGGRGSVRRAAGAAACATALLTGAASLPVQSRTVWDGAYTAEQASRGKAVYDAACAGCHGADLTGIGGQRALTGGAFTTKWDTATVHDLFTQIMATMPPMARGSLAANLYLDIVAYVFQANGFPPGGAELTLDPDTLRAVQIVGRDGPLPPRTGSFVRVVGCLQQSGTAWVLTNASGPIRTRSMRPSAGAELAQADATPLGSETLGLQGTIRDAAAHVGRKMEAKGLLVQTSDGSRVTVMSLQIVNDACQP